MIDYREQELKRKEEVEREEKEDAGGGQSEVGEADFLPGGKQRDGKAWGVLWGSSGLASLKIDFLNMSFPCC